MSLEETGAYTILLSYDWNEVGLPDELAPFSRWLRSSPAKAQRLWEGVKANFVFREGRWYNPRLEKERAKQAENRAKKVAAAVERWHPTADADADAPALQADMQMECPPIPIASPSPKEANTYPPEFELLWKSYPRRAGANKQQTYRLYLRHTKDGIEFDAMHDGALRYLAYVTAKGWIGTEFIKLPQTFFGQDKHFLSEWQTADIRDDKAEKRRREAIARGYIAV